MPTVVGIRLRFSKTLWFDPAGSEPAMGDLVIVETERGTETGTVVQSPHEVADDQLSAPLKPVVRIADEGDLERLAELEEREHEALPVFRSLVAEHGLDMKPIDVEYLFDGDRIVFYFSAEERVDFRALVRELASQFHSRVDMRQVGVRDEARAVGGVGHCGQVLCCVRFGGDFQPVSIRMAKEQDLPLNPLKISGLCGRLMCCLRYEFEAYKDFKGRAPKKGAVIETDAGLAKVTELNTPRELVGLRFEDGNRVTVPLSGMTCSKGSGCPCHVSREVLEEASGSTPLAMPPEPEPARQADAGRKKPDRREKAAGAKGAKSGEKAPDKSAEKTGGGRRRRRRTTTSPDSGGAQPAARSEASRKSDTPDAAAGERQGTEGGSAGTGRSTRRRRRRRKPGGGTAGGE